PRVQGQRLRVDDRRGEHGHRRTADPAAAPGRAPRVDVVAVSGARPLRRQARRAAQRRRTADARHQHGAARRPRGHPPRRALPGAGAQRPALHRGVAEATAQHRNHDRAGRAEHAVRHRAGRPRRPHRAGAAHRSAHRADTDGTGIRGGGRMSAPAPLAGITVVDISRNVPGPYASLLLARLGAEVVTVTGGPTGEALPELSVGKRQITLNLRSQPGVEALHALVRDADVFLEGFRPGVAERLGAVSAQRSEVNPRLVYCSQSGSGQDGPARERAGHDINYLALTGVLGCLGPPDGPPLPPLILVADLGSGGLWAVLGILGALLERERTGRGRFVDAAMVDGVLSMMGTWFAAWGTSVLPGRGRGLVGGEAPFYR